MSEIVAGATATQNDLEEALGGTRKLNDAIQNLAAVAEEQAAASEEMASGAQSMAHSLNEIVSVRGDLNREAEGNKHAADEISEVSRAMIDTVGQLRGLVNSFNLGD